MMSKKTTRLQKAFNTWSIVLIIWALYRAKFSVPLIYDEFLIKPLIFIVPVIYFYRKLKLPLKQNIHIFSKDVKLDFFIGAIAGVIIFVAGVAAHFIKTGNVLFHVQYRYLLFYALIFLVSSISEEFISRGFMVHELQIEYKNIFKTVFYSSALFVFLRIPIIFTQPNLKGPIILTLLLMDFFLGVINSLVYLERKSLVVPIFIHTFYSLSILLFV